MNHDVKPASGQKRKKKNQNFKVDERFFLLKLVMRYMMCQSGSTKPTGNLGCPRDPDKGIFQKILP